MRQTIWFLLMFPVYIFSKLVPKDNKLYLFGSRHGLEIADNAKYLFLHAARNEKDKRCVFLSRNPDVVRLLTEAGYESCLSSSSEGRRLALRARKCFVSHSTHDIHPLLIGGAEIIQLWHGTPLKKIGYDAMYRGQSALAGIKSAARRVLFALFPYLNTAMRFDKLVVSSEAVKPSFRSAFHIDDRKIVVAGQPRNDTMTGEYALDRSVFPEITYLEDLRRSGERLITWMPTHRLLSGGGIAGLLEEYGFEIDAVSSFLAENNARLIVKVHPLDTAGIEGVLESSERITIYPFPDPYPLLTYTDILLTDYSSVYFDFLLTDRPIIFTPFDREAYIRDDADFYYDYDLVTPGPHCRDWSEVISAIGRCLSQLSGNSTDPYAADRRKICRQFNDYSGGNAARIVERLF